MTFLQQLSWSLEIAAPKAKELLTTKATAYFWSHSETSEDILIYRVHFKNYKQGYYFEVPVLVSEISNLESICNDWFSNNRDTNVTVAKCLRCGKWDTATDCYCGRCSDAMASMVTEDLENATFYDRCI